MLLNPKIVTMTSQSYKRY